MCKTGMICFKWALLKYLPNRKQRAPFTPLMPGEFTLFGRERRLERVGAQASPLGHIHGLAVCN
jgi:hypothetical protein